MDPSLEIPKARHYYSQQLRLHFTDWGNGSAPPLILIHGSHDQSRSWDAVAHALRQTFHVIALDLRGHGDSDWAMGSSYSQVDHVYDLACLIKSVGLAKVTIIGHSMGGMVGLTYAGTFPERVSRLIVLDGVISAPGRAAKQIDLRIANWIADLDGIALRNVRRYSSISEGADRILARNQRLTREQALHLATHALRQNAAGGYRWKFDPYVRARTPNRSSPEDLAALYSRIQCPTLLVSGSESFVPDPETAGLVRHFQQAELVKIDGAGHWLHHEKTDEVVSAIQSFLA